MSHKDHLTMSLLQANCSLLSQSLETLRLSVNKAQVIGQKPDYTFEEMETFDSLAAKFGRAADIFTQKVLRSTWILLHESHLPFIDVMNKAEQITLIDSAEKMIEIRDIRNQIAHEYIPEAIQELIPTVIGLTADLEKNIGVAMSFLKKRGWI